MRKTQFKDAYIDPIWEMYECDHGARWTAVKGGISDAKEGDDCNFSGCPKGHHIHVKGETKDRHRALDWFRRPKQRKETP